MAFGFPGGNHRSPMAPREVVDVPKAARASATTDSGTCGQDYPGFHWQMTQETWPGDTSNPMTELTMEVFFPVQGKDHSVRLTTLVNPSNSGATQGQPSSTTTGAGAVSTQAK